MKIKTQVSISLIVFVFLAGVIIFSIYSNSNYLNEIQKKQQIIDNIEKSSFELYFLENDYLVHGGTTPVERWNAKYATLTRQLQELTLTDPSQQVILTTMFENQKELNTSFWNLVAVIGTVKGDETIGASQELKEFSYPYQK
jgi:CHASE3 domain sensor protein